jgi:co-chaperonin GroES (HSP10)
LLQSSGKRLERKADFIPQGATIRPLRDHILVKPLEWKPSKILAIAGSERKTLRGTVVAVGPGTYHWQYNQDRSKRWQSKHFRRTEVKVGDVVELGGLENGGYSFPEVLVGTELHIIASERDVCGIVNEAS